MGLARLAYKYRETLLERGIQALDRLVQACGQTRETVQQTWENIRPKQTEEEDPNQNGEKEQQSA